jgi:hypothetical protein
VCRAVMFYCSLIPLRVYTHNTRHNITLVITVQHNPTDNTRPRHRPCWTPTPGCSSLWRGSRPTPWCSPARAAGGAGTWPRASRCAGYRSLGVPKYNPTVVTNLNIQPAKTCRRLHNTSHGPSSPPGARPAAGSRQAGALAARLRPRCSRSAVLLTQQGGNFSGFQQVMVVNSINNQRPKPESNQLQPTRSTLKMTHDEHDTS